MRGKTYFVLELLSRRGAFRVFDPEAGPGGDYRVLYRLPASEINEQRIEILRRFSGPTANRNFPHLVQYTRSGSDVFVVLSWIWGTNLRDYLRAVREHTTPRPSPTEVVRLMRGLAHGIGHYHRQTKIIHGDVSPANLIISSGTKQLVLVDFGSAWAIEDSATKVPGDGTTLPYAAPERIHGQAAEDLRSDMFSHAVVAYELLTLDIPFDGLGGRAGLPTMRDLGQTLYLPPTRLMPEAARLPQASLGHIDDCLRVGLALQPDHRFGTRSEWLKAWDTAHDACQKKDRFTTWERWIVWAFENCSRVIGGSTSSHR